jgi:acetolactate synthase I/II/III large subunit
MKVSDFVIEFIADQGVRHVFMLPGGGAMHLNDSLGRSERVEFICNLHEQASCIAAEAYGQYSGLGVAMVTSGPGGTNAITGVAGAWLESTPLLVISGQVKRADLVGARGVRQIGFQEIDIISLVKAITKYAVTVDDPRKIRVCLEEAIWHATNGRKGPVWIDIPLDVQAADIAPSDLIGFVNPLPIADKGSETRDAAKRTAELLLSAQRPVVLAGNGIRHAGAIDIFLEWAETMGIPILTTWKALDFLPETHPLYVGRPGAVGQRAANFAQQTSDLFISIGARLDYGQTAYNHAHFAPRAKKVIVDIDPQEISKLEMQIEVPLAADAGAFIKELGQFTAGRKFPDWSVWRHRCATWRSKYPVVQDSYRSLVSGVNAYVLVHEIGRLLREGDILVPGSSGACSEVTAQAVPVSKGIRFINTHGLGAMGFGVPAALGACVASGGMRTICIDGDGGFPMNSQELATVARLNLAIKVFVLNNAGYGSIRATQSNYFNSRFVACGVDSGLTLPNIEKTAESCGIKYWKIRSHLEIEKSIERILESPGPAVCEVQMAEQSTQPKVVSLQQKDGRMHTLPMEDLWPFLDRATFDAEMQDDSHSK